jgi:hypothetical protein
MKRTRKWSYVEQDAIRLAGLGLSPLEIAKRLGVNKSTVTRWIASGKLGKKASRRAAQTKVLTLATTGGKSPAAWVSAVRKDYQLDATDGQLVDLAKAALTMAQDRKLKPRERLSAMAEFRANVKQLALVARGAESASPQGEAPPAPVAEAPRPQPVQRADPRKILMAVK